ncbi:unnamed protein product (macronuclear) [Paramecium tetraurelia]|uniref:Chromosome undetermined scaffold_1, whole genome shotgun sequence n=1 Tax=Paramecium tetraurelia TaxID=5888 RepID=Q6BFJ1_PARTE|nr:hypothetical protein [Paramecium tetraurelia strain d4-2]XP_001423070.1 uncharacterized protein GSPATT00000107001 [Paramecium tetraurelia]CAH03579.1 hypothetical protein with coiled-coil domains [Paramecium tetraurelia]CAK55672.1 unnamed protein product [Paramecium tetraurelia]|eukprot:XP_001423070.1 hypothetical protein (macronuclear) [Paramecium tetraurelia strain d4-2]
MTQRIRSYSFVKKNLDGSGLVKENSILKDKVHKMKFLVEDNLDILINELDQDLKQNASITDMSNVFLIIQQNIERWKNQINTLKNNTKILEAQLERLKEDEEQMKIQTLNDINIISEKKQQQIIDKDNVIVTLNQQVKDLQNQIEINKSKLQDQILHGEELMKQHQQQLIQRVAQLDNEIIQIKQQHQFETQAVMHNHEKDRKFFKEELDNQISLIEQKYKKYYLENQQFQEKYQKQVQQIKQLKQQRDNFEKQLDQQNQKIKSYIEELASERKNKAKENKQLQEQQELINQLQNKILIEEKRQQRLKEQIQQLQDQNQALLQKHNLEINQSNSHIAQLKREIEYKDIYIINQQSNFTQQILIQKVKYENILGNPVTIEGESQEQLTKEFSQQYDDEVQIQYVKGLEQEIKRQQGIILEKSQQNADLQVKFQKLQQSLIQQIEQKVKETQYECKLQFNKMQQEYENQREKMLSEHSYKINLLQQQLSYEVDKFKCELKELQQKIELLNKQIQEKEQIIIYLSEQLQQNKEQQSKDKTLAEANINNLQIAQKQQVEQLEKIHQQKLNDIISQLNLQTSQNEQLNQQYSQLLKNNQELRNESKEQKQSIQQYKIQCDKLSKELQIQWDIAKSLNDRIRQMQVELENAKQTYNIFTKTTRIPAVMSSEIRLSKLRTSPMNRKLRSISNTRLQQLQNL